MSKHSWSSCVSQSVRRMETWNTLIWKPNDGTRTWRNRSWITLSSSWRMWARSLVLRLGRLKTLYPSRWTRPSMGSSMRQTVTLFSRSGLCFFFMFLKCTVIYILFLWDLHPVCNPSFSECFVMHFYRRSWMTMELWTGRSFTGSGR